MGSGLQGSRAPGIRDQQVKNGQIKSGFSAAFYFFVAADMMIAIGNSNIAIISSTQSPSFFGILLYFYIFGTVLFEGVCWSA